jgi:holo-[acyl-carrier protein] synthase
LIMGVGIDIIEIQRIADAVRRYGNAFLNRIYTEAEQKYCLSCGEQQVVWQRLAARFAAKEAVFKCLRVSAKDLRLKDIEILNEEKGKPFVRFHGRMGDSLQELGIQKVMVSLSHSREYAVACAMVAE